MSIYDEYTAMQATKHGFVLLIQIGEFFEIFGEDAKFISQKLGLTVSQKPIGNGETAPMCGFPKKAKYSFLQKLLGINLRIAIAHEKLDSEGTIIREITELHTPGTIIDHELLSNSSSNNILSALQIKDKIHITSLDLTRGSFEISAFDQTTQNLDFIQKLFSPVEVVTLENIGWNGFFEENFKIATAIVNPPELTRFDQLQEISKIIGDTSILQFLTDDELSCVYMLTEYIFSIVGRQNLVLKKPKRLDLENRLKLSNTVINALELLKTKRMEDEGSLLHFMDKTSTPIGMRNMHREIICPLKNMDKIKERLDCVEAILENHEFFAEFALCFEKIGDLERMLTSVLKKHGSKMDLLGINDTFRRLIVLKDLYQNHAIKNHPVYLEREMAFLARNEKTLRDITKKFATEESPIINKIKEWFNYDVIFDHVKMPKMHKFIGKMEEIYGEILEFCSQNGIKKLHFEKATGFYFESKSDQLDGFEYLKNKGGNPCFTSDFFKSKSDELLKQFLFAEDTHEKAIAETTEEIRAASQLVLQICETISKIDIVLSFAILSKGNGFCRPNFVASDSAVFKIKGGKHPFFMMDSGYVPNGCDLGETNGMLITGPNMGGKSTFLRQNALICIMAHMGCFVSCQAATMTIFESIFTRIGSDDSLVHGKSSFLNEMLETAEMTNNANEKSLCIIDELGRGTSSQEGLVIAFEIVKYLASKGCFVLFATHYHELVERLSELKGMKHFSVQFDGTAGSLRITYKIKEQTGKIKSFPEHSIKLAGFATNLEEQILRQLNDF